MNIDDVALKTLHNRLTDDFLSDPDSLEQYLLLNELHAQLLDAGSITERVGNKVELKASAVQARLDKRSTRFATESDLYT